MHTWTHCNRNIAFDHKLYHCGPPARQDSPHRCHTAHTWHFASSFHPYNSFIVSKLEKTHLLFEVTTKYNSHKVNLWIENKQLTVCGYRSTEKAGNISSLVGANDQVLGTISFQQECHNWVAIIVFSFLYIINVPSVFSKEGHLLNIAISLHSIYVDVSFLCTKNVNKRVCVCVCVCHRVHCFALTFFVYSVWQWNTKGSVANKFQWHAHE